MIVKEMIRYDCFITRARCFHALAWTYDPDSGPVLVVRHWSGFTTLISELDLRADPTELGSFYDKGLIHLNAGLDNRFGWRTNRRVVRGMKYELCPSLETSQYVRDLLLEFKAGIMHRASKSPDFTFRAKTFTGVDTYEDALEESDSPDDHYRVPIMKMWLPGPEVQPIA